MHFNTCNRDKEEWQKTINTKGPMPSNFLGTNGQAGGHEDTVLTGEILGSHSCPSLPEHLHNELLESKTHVLLIFAPSVQCLELGVIHVR